MEDPGDYRLAVELRPGIPGLRVDPGATEYPALTNDFAAIVRDLGAEVHFAVGESERQTADLRAGEIWLPVLHVSEAVGVGAVGSLVAEAITRLIHRVRQRDRARHPDGDLDVHVLIGRVPDGGEIKWIELHGDATKVVESLRTLTD